MGYETLSVTAKVAAVIGLIDTACLRFTGSNVDYPGRRRVDRLIMFSADAHDKHGARGVGGKRCAVFSKAGQSARGAWNTSGLRVLYADAD
jgi:hypothetical protein